MSTRLSLLLAASMTAAASLSSRTASAADPIVVTPRFANVPPGGQQLLGATGGTPPLQFTFISNASLGALTPNGGYTAGRRAKQTDTVRVSDASGQTSMVTLSVGAGISISPTAAKVGTGGRLEFAAVGGSGVGFIWSIQADRSGATIDPATGAYRAGRSTHTVDVVRATDSLGNIAEVSVAIGGGLAIEPASLSTCPRCTTSFLGFGGDGGFTWSLVSTPSGGTVDPVSGVYTAGPKGNVQDQVLLVDDLGNRSIRIVDVGPEVALAPPTSAVESGKSVPLTVSGGSGQFVELRLETNTSGGDVGTDFVYHAGPKGGRDTILVVDSVGNEARAAVDVTGPPEPFPEPAPTTSAAPLPPEQLSLAGGGAGGCRSAAPSHAPTSPFALGAIVVVGLVAGLRRRRRR